MTRRRALIRTALVLVAIGVVIGMQWIGPGRTNPPVDASVRLEAESVPQPVATLLRAACYDCHSSETEWPWYAHVAPASWLVIGDVTAARKKLNFSRWGRYNAYDRADMLDKMCEFVSQRKMPLWQYRLLHSSARLSEQDVATLCGWTRDEAARLTRAGDN